MLLLISGAAALAAGIWLRIDDNGGPLNLEYSEDNVFRDILRVGIGSIIIGSFLMLTALFSLFSLSRNCVGKTFRIIYVLMAVVILLVLIAITAIAVVIHRSGDSETVRDFISEAWDDTVRVNPSEICKVESNLDCRGFEDNECSRCENGPGGNCDNAASCASCATTRGADIGCYTRIIDRLENVFLPVAIVGGVLSFVVLVDILVCFCL